MSFQIILIISILSTSYAQTCITNVEAIPKDIVTKLYTSQQIFAIKLLRSFFSLEPYSNLVFSPHSIYHALLLLYFGSTGSEEKVLKKVLYLDWSKTKDEVVKAYLLDNKLQMDIATNRSLDFTSVDKIYIAKQQILAKCILEQFKDNVELLNILNDPETARRYINNFVEEVTRQNIKNLLVGGSITAHTNMVLINAAYFKGVWINKFNKSNTRKEMFKDSKNNITYINMLTTTASYKINIHNKLKCSYIELPYIDKNHEGVSMLILIPDQYTMNQLIENITPEHIREINKNAVKQIVNVKMPKLFLEISYDLASVLSNMGLDTIFNKQIPMEDFIVNGGVSLNSIPHKVKIIVDEEGTVAAAATGIVSRRMNINFHCDIPFIYMIYDYNTENILFMGVFDKPNM